MHGLVENPPSVASPPWAYIQALTRPSYCVTLGKLLEFSVALFLICETDCLSLFRLLSCNTQLLLVG